MRKMKYIGCLRGWRMLVWVSAALWVSAPLSLSAQTNNDLMLASPYDFKLCNGDAVKGEELEIFNQSSHTGLTGGVYSVDWGDGSPVEVWNGGGSMKHRYYGFQVYKLVFSWRSANGSKVLSRTYDVLRLNKPDVALKMPDVGVCQGEESVIQIIDYDKQSPGTTYKLVLDRDGTRNMTQQEVVNMGGIFKHIFKTESCPIRVDLDVRNECSATLGAATPSYRTAVIVPPKVSFFIQGPSCTGYPLNIQNNTYGGKDLDCNENMTYIWRFEGQPVSFDRVPVIVYDKPGTYQVSLTVRTGSAECSERVVESVVKVIESPKVDFEVSNNEICSGTSVSFINKSTGEEPLTFQWMVWKDDGWAQEGFDFVYENGTHANSREPRIRFHGYGRFHVRLTLSNSCPESEKEVTINVRKNPEVYLYLKDIICSDADGNKTLNFADGSVSYIWNGNDARNIQPTWFILNMDNNQMVYMGQDLYPQVTLAGSTTYGINVSMPPATANGVECPDPGFAEHQLRIPSMKIDLAFDPEPSGEPIKVCFDETLEFTNNSVGENLKCRWTLTPVGKYRNEIIDADLEDRTATLNINFGEYELKAEMSIAGTCPVETTKSYKIQVGHRPEIVACYLDGTTICPGDVLDMQNVGLVNYHLYNNPELVQWTFSPSLPGEAYLDGDPTAIKPIIQFSTPGVTYHYKLEMPDDHLVPGCEDKDVQYVNEGTISVLNNQVSSQIKEEQDRSSVCEGSNLIFSNEGRDPQGGIITTLEYEWSVIDDAQEKTDLCEIVDPPGNGNKIVTVKFLHYGVFGVVGKTKSDCAEAYDTVWITVKKNPLVTFSGDRQEVCPGEVKMAEWVDIAWYNNSPSQLIGWLLERDGQPVWQGETSGDADMPVVPVTEPGDYAVSVSVPGVGCPETTVRKAYTLHVIDTAIRGMETILPRGYGLPRGLCVGEDLVFENDAEAERELRWHWTVEGTAGGYGFDGTDAATSSLKTPTLRFSMPGDYTVHLTIEEGCNTREWAYPLKVRGVPVLQLEDQAGCESAFRFVGKDEVKAPALDLKNNELLAAAWTVTTEYGGGSYDWSEGGSTSLYPTIAFAPVESSGYCLYRVTVEYTNHCPDLTVASFQVRIDEQVKIDPLKDEDICELEEARRLQVAVPDTGVWSLTDGTLDAGILEKHADGYFFNPAFSAYEDREVRLRYTIRNGACVSSDEMTMRVHALPFVDGGRDLQMCYNHEPLPLVGRDSIKGGKWQENRGTWKLGKEDLQYEFDIKRWNVPPGDYTLTYEYTYVYEAYNYGCPNTDRVTLTVQALPDKRFAVADTLCVGVEHPFVPADTVGHSFEWHFDFLHEPERKEESVGTSIRHAYDRHGFYTVKCMASKPYPYHESVLVCRDTSEKTVTVLRDPPAVYFDVDTNSGCAPLDIQITTDARHYDTLTFADFTYTWDFGNGEGYSTRQLEEELMKTYRSATWDTTYFLSLAVGNRCKTFRHDTAVTVLSVPKVGMAPEQDWECSPVEAFVKNTTTGNNCKFTWSIYNDRNGDTIRIPHVWDLNHPLETDSVTTVYYIHLHAENVCATDDSTVSLKVLPRTIEAHFSPLDDRYACEREEIYFRNNSTDTASNILVTRWDFGDGFTSENWEMRHAYGKEGTYDVSLWIHNGCGWAADTQQVHINPLPKLSIISQDTLCEEDEFHFSFETDMELSLYEWKLQDTLMKRDSFDYVFEGYGKFPVTLIGTSMTFTRCQDSVIKTVVVNNKPIITILPLDTMVCSPLNYIPFVEGEYETLLWDYGDGTELTSAPEHVYENRSDSAYRYVVTAFVTTDKGCFSDYVRRVTVYNTPVALLDKVVEGGRPQRVTFQNLSEGANAGHWILPLQGEVYSVDNQTEEFLENGTYPVTLIASNRYGCADTITLSHEVSLHGLYFPNTFIPHSLNEKISRFNGVGMGLQSYRLEILDQYGNVLWVTEELQDGKPVGGWDGTNRKGERMPQGVYIWRAKAIYGNDDVWTGDNNDSGIPEYTQGTVLLLRE